MHIYNKQDPTVSPYLVRLLEIIGYIVLMRQCHMFCTVKHRPILKCGKNTASMLMKTQATSSTSELRVTVRTGN